MKTILIRHIIDYKIYKLKILLKYIFYIKKRNRMKQVKNLNLDKHTWNEMCRISKKIDKIFKDFKMVNLDENGNINRCK